MRARLPSTVDGVAIQIVGVDLPHRGR
jgi:hypothetical protein